MSQLNSTVYDGHLNLVTLDLTAYGDQVYGYMDSSPLDANSLPELSTRVWQGQVFQPLPFTTAGWQRGGENLVRPTITVPDFLGGLYVQLVGYGLAPGAPITRYQALAADILANDPNAPFSEERYLLNSVSFDGMAITLELATHLDYQRAKFPAHVMYRDEFPGLGSNLAR